VVLHSRKVAVKDYVVAGIHNCLRGGCGAELKLVGLGGVVGQAHAGQVDRLRTIVVIQLNYVGVVAVRVRQHFINNQS
jgi:hypothetical protein